MRKIIVVFILLLLIPITKVEGAVCSYSEIARLKKIASNVTVSYDYIENNSSVVCNFLLKLQLICYLKFYNIYYLNDELYFVDQSNYQRYNYTEEELTISNYRSGQTIRYVFYATDPDCDDTPLYTARVILPTYNQYYKDEVCNGIENYSLCQKWSSHNLTYTNFVQKVNEYKNSLNSPTIPVEPSMPVEVSITQLIVDFLLDYYIYIVIILLLALIGFLSIRKKDDIYS